MGHGALGKNCLVTRYVVAHAYHYLCTPSRIAFMKKTSLSNLNLLLPSPFYSFLISVMRHWLKTLNDNFFIKVCVITALKIENFDILKK